MLKKVPRSPRCLTRPPTDKKKGPEVVVLNYENVLQVQNHLRMIKRLARCAGKRPVAAISKIVTKTGFVSPKNIPNRYSVRS